jgi:Inositol-pentakisphosphate 2-kinase
MKMKNEKIKSVSSYCPIDLFSGDAERMNGAILGLLTKPQNNLKIFLDGKMIYNEFIKDKNSLRKAFASLFPETSFSEMWVVTRKSSMLDFHFLFVSQSTGSSICEFDPEMFDEGFQSLW